MSKTIEQILVPRPEARPRIYAYSIDDKAHGTLALVGGCLGQPLYPFEGGA